MSKLEITIMSAILGLFLIGGFIFLGEVAKFSSSL